MKRTNRHFMITAVAALIAFAFIACEGPTGPRGATGDRGYYGQAGADGLTPRIDAVTGTWWIGNQNTGIPARGQDGDEGLTPRIDAVTGTWWIGTQDTEIPAQGAPGVVVPVTGITLTGNGLVRLGNLEYTLNVAEGSSVILSAAAYPANALVQTLLWDTSDTAVASIRRAPVSRNLVWTGPGMEIQLEAVTEGTAEILVTAQGSGLSGVTAIVEVTVEPLVRMVRVPGGVFELGRELGTAFDVNTTPVSTVTLTGFYMSKFPITQGQFHEVMGFNPSWFTTAQGNPPADGEADARRPVESVSWYDAIVFANRLSILSGLTPAYEMETAATPGVWSTDPETWGPVPTWNDPALSRWNTVRIVSGATGYRLPTEAQWEFAAKGGADGGSYTFAGSNDANAVAWHDRNSGGRTREVGGLASNGLGIHDMSGNVIEWVWDWFGSYTSEPKTDPLGASSGSHRVKRNGSSACWVVSARSVDRRSLFPFERGSFIGFRVVRP